MNAPEQYWIDRRGDVIGLDVFRDGINARQAPTYRAIADWLIRRNVTDLLDIGCNVAALAYFLRIAGYQGRYLGVDTNPFAVRMAKRRELADIGSIRALRYANREFQAVVVKDVVEHLEGPETLAEAFRVAAEYVLVATYIPWSSREAEIVRHADGYYTNRYNRQQVYNLAADWGYLAAEAIPTRETNGTENELVIFQRL